LSLCPKG